MHHYMRTQLYIARQTAHMHVQQAAAAQQHCSTTCICSSCVPLCCCAAVLRAVLLCCCDHEALTCAMSCSCTWVLHALFKLSVGCNVSMKCCCTCICEHCSTRAHHSTAQHSTAHTIARHHSMYSSSTARHSYGQTAHSTCTTVQHSGMPRHCTTVSPHMHICVHKYSTAHAYAAQMYTGTIMASTEVHQQR